MNRKIIIRSNLSPQGWEGSYFKTQIFKYLLSKADLIIVNSDDFNREMRKFYGIKSTTIYNPINGNKYLNYQNTKKIKFFKEKTINLINVGRFVHQKNQIELLHAFLNLKNSIREYRLLIIGYGPEK